MKDDNGVVIRVGYRLHSRYGYDVRVVRKSWGLTGELIDAPRSLSGQTYSLNDGDGYTVVPRSAPRTRDLLTLRLTRAEADVTWQAQTAALTAGGRSAPLRALNRARNKLWAAIQSPKEGGYTLLDLMIGLALTGALAAGLLALVLNWLVPMPGLQ